MIPIAPELGRQIQQRIDALDAADVRRWPVRVCQETMNALPLDGNQIYLWALRPDGVVLCLDHESASLPFEPETDPLKLYEVLRKGARTYPELRELVPAPPQGVRDCELCGGTGQGGQPPPTEACPRCGGLGWYALSRPAADWLNRIDRGDQLTLRTASGARGLVAGRLAGFYVGTDGDEYGSSPVSPAARQALIDRLTAWERGDPVTPMWRPNPTAARDPFDSLEHSLKFFGTGTGGSWEVELARQPDGSYRVSETLHNDFDPAGPAFPTTTARLLDAVAAREHVEREMRAPGRSSPFPAIVSREPG